jgi:hypothetical protein
VTDLEELTLAFTKLGQNADLRAQMGAAGMKVTRAQQGAAALTIRALQESCLPAKPQSRPEGPPSAV